MKRVFVVIIGLAGVGGLIALLMYHPKPMDMASAGGSSPSKSPVSTASTSPSSSVSGPSATGQYKDGTYTGTAVQNDYGPVQVQAVVSGGKLTAVNVLQMPNSDPHAQEVTSMSKPILVQEALQAQGSNVDTVSGATQDSQSFQQSLQSALSQANS